ncbi:MAG: VWA domain-containing protein [Deinococcales bacterium]
MTTYKTDKLRRWRLVLGGDDADGTGCQLGGDDLAMDGALGMLYEMSPEDKEKNRMNVGKGASNPHVARWLGDIRRFFPSTVVRVIQKDAFERYGLKRMLLEPEFLTAVEPDVHLISTLLSLKGIMPQKTKETARLVVQKVVEELEKKLSAATRQAVLGSLNRAIRNYRPKYHEIDWPRTIKANLKHYQPDYQTIIPERRIGHGRKRRSSLKDIILCIDQSGSMATSVVYAGIFGAVLASLPALSTRVVVYDTAVVDLTDELDDPVDVLFGTQLGGGNDTPRALDYCQGLISRPEDTIFVLISDLYEGHGSGEMLERLKNFIHSGVQVIALLALSDDGRPSYDQHNASAMSAMSIPVFACTPDLFPDLMAAAINRQDLKQWAAEHDLISQA